MTWTGGQGAARALRLALLVPLGILATVPARAADTAAVDAWPARSITLIGSSPPGGGIEVAARQIGVRLAERFKQTVIVETRPGADGRIATQVVASAPADGYTLLVTPTSTAIDIAFDPSLRPNVIRDLAPISPLLRTDTVLVVHPKVPVDTVAGLIAYAKAHPGELNFATPGPRSSPRLVTELFKLKTGIDIVHVPYKGAVPQMAGLLSGDVQLSFAPVAMAMPLIHAGKLRALAIASPRRSAVLPDVPTMKEAGVDGVEGSIWYGLFAPGGTPRPIVDRLSLAVQQVTRQDAAYRDALMAGGAEPLAMTADEFGAMLEAEVRKWRVVIEAAKVRVDE